MNLLEVLRRATGYLEQHGSDSPRLDAEVLLAHALGVRRLDLYLQFERVLTEAELVRYRELAGRRARGEPVAYLTGRKEFMGLSFEVTPEVLVPNPDTEVLVQRAVAICRERGGPVRVADVGTGSGCIAVAVAHFVPEATVFASDDSGSALEVARRNCDRLGVGERVMLAEGDLMGPLPAQLDLVCANLPYVAEDAPLADEVTAQPGHALRGGPRGFELVARLLREAPARMAARGILLAEVDPSIAAELLPVAEGLYAGVRLHRDLGGLDRVLEAWRS